MVQAFVLRDVARLDPVTVIVNQVANDRAQLLVECGTEAWAAWFVHYEGGTLREHLTKCSPEYLADKLHSTFSRRTTRADRVYERRVAEAVIDAFKQFEGGGS